MSLYKRGKTYHTDFSVNGQRFRQSLETTDWREAQSKEKDLIADAQAGKLSPTKQAFARMKFRDAADQFLEDRKPRLAPLSVRTELERGKVVNKTFGEVQVRQIKPEDILAYIRERKAAKISNATVNRELDILRGVLKRAKRWHEFTNEILPLPIRHNVGRVLTRDEKVHLLKLAESKPEWQNAAWAATLALNTTMRGCEIKQLLWRDVDFSQKTVTIRKSKTEAGERVIPLNAEAWECILKLRDRAKLLGNILPSHFVFPACEASNFDPTRPQRSWRTAWRTLTRLITCPQCQTQQKPGKICSNGKCGANIEKVRSVLAGLRFHDLRHHAITELAESHASDSTVMAIAGHVSPKMLQHYSHVRIDAKRIALDALSANKASSQALKDKKEGYDTDHGTKGQFEDERVSQLIENLVELVGIEPTTSSLRTMRSPS